MINLYHDHMYDTIEDMRDWGMYSGGMRDSRKDIRVEMHQKKNVTLKEIRYYI